MSAYYPSLDIALIDQNGRRSAVPGIDVDYSVSSGATGTVTADSFGVINEGSVTGAAGDTITFSVAGYTETVVFTLQSTQEKAFTAVENAANVLILENQIVASEVSERADVYLSDVNDASIPPVKIGTVNAGETAVIPYAVTKQKDLKLRLVSKSKKGRQSVTDLERSSENYDITIPAPSGVSFAPLFDVFADAATTGTARETLCQYSMPTGVLDHTGDKIVAEFAGIFAANTNAKRVYISFAGTDVLDSGSLTENATHWHAKVTIVRASQTQARVIADFASGAFKAPQYSAVSALDLDANGYDLKMDGTTVTAAGDLSLKMAYGMLVPRLPQTNFGTQLGGFSWAFTLGSIGGGLSQADLGGFYWEFTLGSVDHYVFDSDPPDDPGDWQPPHCFAAGTLVWMGDGSAKPIEQIEVGDYVMAWTDQGWLLPARVLAFTGGESAEYRRLTFTDDVLENTSLHPYCADWGEKVLTEQMQAGQRVRQFEDDWTFGELISNEIAELEEPKMFYNWEIERHHRYCVRSPQGKAWKAVFNKQATT